MCRVLGRTPSSLQRLMVKGWVPRRGFRSAHVRPDSSLNRTSRSGKSAGKSSVSLVWCMRCLGTVRSFKRAAGSLSPRRAQTSPFVSAPDLGRPGCQLVRLSHPSVHMCGLFCCPLLTRPGDEQGAGRAGDVIVHDERLHARASRLRYMLVENVLCLRNDQLLTVSYRSLRRSVAGSGYARLSLRPYLHHP